MIIFQVVSTARNQPHHIFTHFSYHAYSHLQIGRFMLVAGDGHHIGPIGRFHEYACDLSTGDMEGGGAVLKRALDASPLDLARGVLMAVHALLQKNQRERGRL